MNFLRLTRFRPSVNQAKRKIQIIIITIILLWTHPKKACIILFRTKSRSVCLATDGSIILHVLYKIYIAAILTEKGKYHVFTFIARYIRTTTRCIKRRVHFTTCHYHYYNYPIARWPLTTWTDHCSNATYQNNVNVCVWVHEGRMEFIKSFRTREKLCTDFTISYHHFPLFGKFNFQSNFSNAIVQCQLWTIGQNTISLAYIKSLDHYNTSIQ